MFAEFISMPISGQYHEKHFGTVGSISPQWVKFTDERGEEWVGSFDHGWEGHESFIIVLDTLGKAFVVAGGRSFLININTREKINKVEVSDTKTALVHNRHHHIYYSSGYDLNYMDINGNIFNVYNDYYFDDIKLVEIRDNRLYAKYWSFQSGLDPFDIEIDLLTKEVKDSFYDLRKEEDLYESPKPNWLVRVTKWITN